MAASLAVMVLVLCVCVCVVALLKYVIHTNTSRGYKLCKCNKQHDEILGNTNYVNFTEICNIWLFELRCVN